jgi:ABC-type polysaccharide/polyol phosphate transport system ATPase subunit
MTGRENIFLNGSLLGHRRGDVESRVPWILEFSDLGEFIDAPIRTYSTGMVARLGFAVATAWEPDILLVDEILSVGDEVFRRKCLSRLGEFKQRGATFLVVSHDLVKIRELCDRVLWLKEGRVERIGNASVVVDAYVKDQNG